MSHHDVTYNMALSYVLAHGTKREDRTGTGTIGVFAPPVMRFDLNNGFPLLTTKKIHTRSVFEELIWFLSGSTNNRDLQEKGVSIWDEWAAEDGELGPIYGKQWRAWESHPEYTSKTVYIDQISNLIEGIKNDPYSRRHIVSAWNVADIPEMALAPCHCMFQVHIEGKQLNLNLYQRSADMFLGVPFNIASYALLTHMLAAQTGYKPGVFTHMMGDAHIYLNHVDQVNEQMLRPTYLTAPTLELDSVGSIFHYTTDHIHVRNYNPMPAIKAEVSV